MKLNQRGDDVRQYKFRAWIKKTGDMLFDVQNVQPVFGQTFKDFLDVNYCELMQYTGLTDKHGVEIYEGDVINFDRHLWEIKFVHGCFRAYNLTNPEQLGAFYGPDQLSLGSMDDHLLNVEVVGNVYENPELIERKNAG